MSNTQLPNRPWQPFEVWTIDHLPQAFSQRDSCGASEGAYLLFEF